MHRVDPAPVSIERSDPRRPRIEAIAERLDVPIDVTAPPSGADAQVAGVALPTDAPDWLIEAALLRAAAPAHVLFLCVANSARSQLAEGIARAAAARAGAWGDAGPVRVSSAGSEPTSVRPQAIAALDEIGIDISGNRSTGIDEVERPVDAVITLCAEEVCPAWLESARRVHWGLPDPAAATGSDEDVLDAFRSVRDELRVRLGVLFAGRAE